MMKKSTLIFVCIMMFATNAIAGFEGPGASVSVVSVKSANEMKDDDAVIMEGYLIKQLKTEHYIFKDDTGEIEVEIDDEDFKGVKVTPKTKIRIIGEVDKNWNSLTIDANYIEVIE
jgi:uncharacterized protein (TIGR00156 family)